MLKEIWKDVVGYEALYQVSNLGRVRSKNRLDGSGNKRKGMVRKLNPQKDGYIHVNLCKSGKVKHIGVHRLVAQAFIPNPQNKPQVNHIDGDKANNHLSNLEWSTRSENMIHALKIGLVGDFKGSGNIKAKLKENQVMEIRRLRKSDPKKYTHKKLGEMFGVTSANISDIVNRKSWKHLKDIDRKESVATNNGLKKISI